MAFQRLSSVVCTRQGFPAWCAYSGSIVHMAAHAAQSKVGVSYLLLSLDHPSQS